MSCLCDNTVFYVRTSGFTRATVINKDGNGSSQYYITNEQLSSIRMEMEVVSITSPVPIPTTHPYDDDD